jgi:hypothetical protein
MGFAVYRVQFKTALGDLRWYIGLATVNAGQDPQHAAEDRVAIERRPVWMRCAQEDTLAVDVVRAGLPSLRAGLRAENNPQNTPKNRRNPRQTRPKYGSHQNEVQTGARKRHKMIISVGREPRDPDKSLLRRQLLRKRLLITVRVCAHAEIPVSRSV